jgi:hypothetical protein
MLLAKISPSANIVLQVTPFIFDQNAAQYMTAVANQYVPDAESTSFSVLFGEMSVPVPSEQPQPEPFVLKYSYPLTLTSEQLSSWGTDDSELLEIIAAQLGVEILEFINVP